MSAIVKSEKLSSGHSRDVFPFSKEPLAPTDQHINDFFTLPRRRIEGALIQKVGHYFLDILFLTSLRL